MKNKKILLILILFVIVLILLVGSTYSSFFGNISGFSATKVAEPVFILENTDKKVLDASNTEIDYYFSIKNYDNNKVNEVKLKYMLEISPKQDDAIVLTLYKDNQIVKLTNQSTSYIALGHTNKENQEYRLNVKYDKTKLDDCYDISSNISIRASAIQE